MHHRCTLAGLPASMAFRWRKSPCRPSLSQKNTASRGRMGQICGKSKKSEQARVGAWGTGGNADNGSGGCGYIAWPGAGRTPRLPSPVAARRVGIAAPKPVCLPNGMRLLRRNSSGRRPARRDCARARPAVSLKLHETHSGATTKVRGHRARGNVRRLVLPAERVARDGAVGDEPVLETLEQGLRLDSTVNPVAAKAVFGSDDAGVLQTQECLVGG